MKKEQYLEMRNSLYAEAEGLINESKLEEADAKMKEIEALDNKYEEASKVMANLNAMKDSAKISNVVPMEINNKIGEIKGDDEMEISNSLEYRKAFMNHVISGAPISAELRNEVGNTLTTDVGTVIPKTVMQRIIERIEANGMILSEITRTSYKGGLAIPTSNMKPVATWVKEGQGSDKQKKTTGEIVFAYHKLRCAINMSLEVSVTTLDVFESVFVAQVSEAMIKALETAIVSGDGAGKPKGILLDANLDVARDVSIAKAKSISYADIVKAEGLLDIEYEAGAVWFMSKKQFMEIAGMVDSAGQPVGRINYGGYANRPEYSILGRRVVLHNYMPTGTSGVLGNRQVVAFLINPKDYILNTNLNMTMKRYTDEDTDDEIIKSVMLVDGQLAVKDSLITISKAQ